MAGYIRQSTFVDGDTITAALFNNEYNQLVNAFSNTSGHKHDGTTAEGPVIGLIGDAGETSPNNKVLIDTTNNYIEFYVEVSSAPVQQLYIADGAIIPVTDSDIDLGTTSLRFKDTYTDTVTTTGNVSIGGDLTVTGSATISGNLTFGDADTDSINLAAEIDSDIIPNTDGTYDLGSATKEWQDLYIDGTANIDSLVADTADINGGTIDGATIATSDITVGAGKTLNVSAGTLTLADDQISGDKVEGGTIAATTITTLTSTTGNITNVNATTVDSTNLEVTNLKAKDGTAAGSIADSTGVVTLASSVLTTTDINGGTIDGVTIGGSSAGAVTFTDLSDGTITIAGFADEDNMVSNSATLLPTQQSVKAYVDAQVTAQDLDFQGDTGGALSIDLDSESLTIAGGTGIDTSGATNTLTVAIDSTVATLTGTQTLTNKTLTTPIISSISNTGTLTLPTSTDTLVGRATTDTLTNKTLTSPDVNTPDIDGGTIDGTVIGGATPAAADFTTMDTTGNASVGGNLSVTGDLTINGTTTTVNSTTVTIDDPIFTLGGDTAPASDDNKDRGIEFRWHNGTAAKVGFFGYDDSASVFTFIPDATNTSEVFSGSAGNVAFGNIAGTLTTAAQPNITSVGTLTDLDVQGDTARIQIRTNDPNDTELYFWTRNTSDTAIFQSSIKGIVDGGMAFGTVNTVNTDTTERLRITATGNVGIGTTSVDQHLHVEGSGTQAIKVETTSDDYAIMQYKTSTSSLWQSFASPSNDYRIGINGVGDALTIDSSFNVGIGTTNPTSYYAGADNLVVYQASGEAGMTIATANNTTGALYFADGTSGSEAYQGGIAYDHSSGLLNLVSGGATKVSTDSSGNVGIGTTSPLALLDVAVLSSGARRLLVNYADSIITLQGANSSSTNESLRVTGDNLRFATGSGTGTERMRIDSSGNVGIGTSSPARELDIQAASGWAELALRGASGSAGSLEYYNASTKLAEIYADTSTNIIFRNSTGGTTERMRIDSSGNLLVGTTSQINLSTFSFDSGSSRGGIFENSATAAHTLQVQNTNASYADLGGGMLYINQSGGATPSGFRAISVYANSIARFAVRGDGTIYSSNTTVQSISDERFKENVKNLETGLSEVMNLKPRRFDWKEGRGTNQKNVAGFIAQEIETVLPDLVDEFKDGLEDNEMYKTVGYTGLIPTLVKAIQEQQTIIDDLKSRIEALEG